MREVDPMTTPRADSWQAFHRAPMPMVTIFQTWDITELVSFQATSGYKLNMLLCWCIGRGAQQTKEFYLLPVGDKLLAYEKLGISVIVANRAGGIHSCDIPFCEDLNQFEETMTERAAVRTDRRPLCGFLEQIELASTATSSASASATIR